MFSKMSELRVRKNFLYWSRKVWSKIMMFTVCKHALDEQLEEINSLSASVWGTKFVQEGTIKRGSCYPPRFL